MSQTRRQKDILQRNTAAFVKATTEDYSRYLEGSPVYITYYQLNTEKSRQDSDLENVHSLFGPNSPNKYNRIYDVPVYGLNDLSLDNIYSDGVKTEVSGEFIMLPETLRMYPGDFFIIEDTYEGEDISNELFRIEDVQFDKVTAKKYLKASFKLYSHNSEELEESVIQDNVLVMGNIGGEPTMVVTKEAAVVAEEAKLYLDSFIDEYIRMFYDDGLDMFVYRDIEDVINWNPVLQNFLNKHKLLTKYNKEILTEIYIDSIDDVRYPFYDNRMYAQSIYNRIVRERKPMDYDDMKVFIHDYRLKENKNLPFMFGSSEANLLIPAVYRPRKNTIDPASYDSPEEYLEDYLMFVAKSSKLLDYFENETFLDMSINSRNIGTFSIPEMYDDGEVEEEEFIFLDIINRYMDRNIEVSEIIELLEPLYFSVSLFNYHLMPLIIYIIKDLTMESLK